MAEGTYTHKRTCAHAIAPPILATVRVPRCRRTHLTFGMTKLVSEYAKTRVFDFGRWIGLGDGERRVGGGHVHTNRHT